MNCITKKVTVEINENVNSMPIIDLFSVMEGKVEQQLIDQWLVANS